MRQKEERVTLRDRQTDGEGTIELTSWGSTELALAPLMMFQFLQESAPMLTSLWPFQPEVRGNMATHMLPSSSGSEPALRQHTQGGCGADTAEGALCSQERMLPGDQEPGHREQHHRLRPAANTSTDDPWAGPLMPHRNKSSISIGHHTIIGFN